MKKAWVSGLTAAMIFLSLAACGGKKAETVDELPEPDRIVINAGPEERDFSNWQENAREAVYEKGSEGYEELYGLTAARWKKADRKGELSDEAELETYAHRWSSEPEAAAGREPAGLLMFFEYDEPIPWNKNGVERAEALVFRPGHPKGGEADRKGEFSVQCGGEFLDTACAYGYLYSEELAKAAERLAP